ncbi:M23 family metallopeptidase [Nocardioides sp. NPDC004968]|uniref:M23 family metallopeptidase n=1 Tax=Nocardioides sp. NPDC004968 TaxID=3155894 RepID=UPI0033A2F742
MRLAVVAAIFVALLLSPVACLSSVAIVVQAVALPSSSCGGSIEVGDVPDHLTTRTANGITITLDRTQLTHAATIATIGSRTPGIGREGVRIALMAALTESSLQMLTNTSAWPESTRFPNDGNGGDHDSLGLFQMRPLAGWGTVAQLMNSTYQARAFFGGDNGPNHGSPRGLLDIPGWRQLAPGVAAQAVEVSAFPDRYAQFEPVADAIINALASRTKGQPSKVPETSRIVFPLPKGTWNATSPYGWRIDPVTGANSLHTGNDYAAPLGTPILAIGDGTVTYAGAHPSGYAHLILIDHTIRGRKVTSGYAHMYGNGIHVRIGDRVAAGQHIADVGSDGKSLGPHLHFEIRLNGHSTYPTSWLNGSQDLPDAARSANGCPTAMPGPDSAPDAHVLP